MSYVTLARGATGVTTVRGTIEARAATGGAPLTDLLEHPALLTYNDRRLPL